MNIRPFGSLWTCPACGLSLKGFSVQFSTDHKIPIGDGRFVSTQTIGDALIPHLEKHCPHCEWGWLEHAAEELDD